MHPFLRTVTLAMPTSCTWKVPFRGKFGAYSADGATRLVPAFSVQSLQRNTVVAGPPKTPRVTREVTSSNTEAFNNGTWVGLESRRPRSAARSADTTFKRLGMHLRWMIDDLIRF